MSDAPPSAHPSTPGSLAVPSGLSTQNLILDSAIRDWVVLPLLVIMIAAGLLRQQISTLLRAKSRPIPFVEGRTKQLLMRSNRLRSGAGGYLGRDKWEGRRRAFSARDGGEAGGGGGGDGEGLLRAEAEWAEGYEEGGGDGGKKDIDPMEAMNPMAMMEGMKGNMVFMVQNMVMMQGISHFFRGFVLVRVPFPLTNGFKMMFQRGLDLGTLDTSYVSSVSWYFLVMYGLRGFFRLVMGDPKPEIQEGVMIQQDLGMVQGPANPTNQFDAPKALRTEADNLEIVKMRCMLDDVEKKLLGRRYPKKRIVAAQKGGTDADDILGIGSVSSRAGKGKSSKLKKRF